jgi:hypothetical protein
VLWRLQQAVAPDLKRERLDHAHAQHTFRVAHILLFICIYAVL